MSLDGLAIRALAEELHHTLVDGRIDKIQQPDNQSIVLTIRARGKNQRLFLSAHPQSAHMGLINANKNAAVCATIILHGPAQILGKRQNYFYRSARI